MIHLLIDVLEIEGYFFQSHYSAGVDGQLKSETIKTIWFQDNVIFNSREIEVIGMKIHSYIIKQVEMNKFTFEPNELVKQKT